MDYFVPSMEDGFRAIVNYVEEFLNVSMAFHTFLFNYVWGYWFQTMGPTAITVYNKDIRTNNYVKSYHASLLKLFKPHPKIWEFISMIYFQTFNIYSCYYINIYFL